MRRLSCAVGLALLLTAGWANAQDGPGATEKAQARLLMDKGDASVAAGDLKTALDNYAGADALMRVPSTGIALGRVQLQLGMLVEAQDVLLRVTRYPEKPDEPDVFSSARPEAAKLLEGLSERIPEVAFTFAGLPEGTTPRVVVDGNAVPTAVVALPRALNPGDHVVLATAEGFLPVELKFSLKERQNRKVDIAFTADAAAHTSTGVASEPADVPPDAPLSGVSTLAIVGFATAGVGIVVGAIAGGLTLSNSGDLADRCRGNACSESERSDLDSAYVTAHISTVSFAVAGAGAVVGIVGLLGGAAEAPAEALQILPGPGGLLVRGTF